MRSFVRLLSAFVLLLAAAEASFAACGDNPGDAQAVAATRAQIAQQCPCSGFRSHGAYQRCASGVTNQAVQAGTLSKACAEVVNNCAGNSTCGRSGAVTCCQTDATGATTCSVVSRASACKAPSGGSACVGTQSSCCDACVPGGCAGGGGTTTTTLATTTTTVATTTTTVATTTTTVATTTTTVATTTTTAATTTTTAATTTTTAATTTTTPTTTLCGCAGGTPTRQSFTTTIGSGSCGHLASDTNPNFFQLACAGLYFGGAGVGTPLPSTVPDMGTSVTKVTCLGTTLTQSGTTPTETGGNRCTLGALSKRGTSCTADSDCALGCASNADCTAGGVCISNTCSGPKCALLTCTNAGCLFGPPLPIPNPSHNGAATSTCVINTVSANAAGTADCSAGSTTALSIPLSSAIFLSADLMPMRCSGGSTPGVNCTGSGGCGTTVACAGGGTCVNDTGRCRSGLGSCTGGSNHGLAGTPGDSIPNGDYPTSHDCPAPSSLNIGALPIGFVLDTGTVTRTAADLTDQANVFCGFCKNKTLNTFARKCNGSPTGANCTADSNCSSGQKCLAVPCTANADCTAVTGFTSCGQRTSGAFCSGDPTSAGNACSDLARTIVDTGAPAGALTTGGASKPATLVSIFCIPPTFNTLVDSAADRPGPGAVSL